MPPDLTEEEATKIPPAVADIHNPGIDASTARPSHNMFVDDNITAALRAAIVHVTGTAIQSAHICFGHPDNDRRDPVLQPEKWEEYAHYFLTHLGYDICTRTMRVQWPAEKRAALLEIIREWISTSEAGKYGAPIRRSPKQLAILLGHLRHGAFVFPQGIYLVLGMQFLLSDAVRSAGNRSAKLKRWWGSARVYVHRSVLQNLYLLRDSLLPTCIPSPWSRPIGLLVRPREPTDKTLTDASYMGLGAWSYHFDFFWRLHRDDLIKAGIPLPVLSTTNWEPTDLSDQTGTHINVLEFVALIINIWLILTILRSSTAFFREGGNIVECLADNTSALSWMRYATRTKRTDVRNLSYILHALLLYSGTSDQVQFVGCHIPGILNDEADALSRPEKFPTLASVIARFSHLRTLRCTRIPFALVQCIAEAISSNKTAEMSEQKTIALLKLAPSFSKVGSNETNLTSGFCSRTRRHKSSR
jgi:hypothetical protein